MTAIKAQGTLIRRGDGGDPTEIFSTVGEVVSFTGPSGTLQVIDVTNLSSTAKEFVPGLPDYGSVAVEGNFAPGDVEQFAIKDDFQGQTIKNFQIAFTDVDSTRLDIAGFVESYSVSLGVDDKVSVSFSIKITDEPAWTTDV